MVHLRFLTVSGAYDGCSIFHANLAKWIKHGQISSNSHLSTTSNCSVPDGTCTSLLYLAKVVCQAEGALLLFWTLYNNHPPTEGIFLFLRESVKERLACFFFSLSLLTICNGIFKMRCVHDKKNKNVYIITWQKLRIASWGIQFLFVLTFL